MSIRVRLGTTGLHVSPVCYGSWQLSPRFWGDQPEDELIKAMRRAFEVDVNFYDTADAYGEGLAETVMGKALKGLPRDQIVVATKLYHHFYPDGHRHGDLSYDYVLAECDASLKRLDMDYIDLYQCHSYDDLTPMEETVAALEKLVVQGKIRAYGHSNFTVEQMRVAARFGRFGSCQPPYSLLNRGIEKDVLPYCYANDIGTLVFSPLHKGLLTGKYTGVETFDDLRKGAADFTGQRFKDLCAKVKQAGEIGKKYGLTTVQTIIACTIMHPSITCAIVGIKSARHIEEAAGAMGKTISRDDWYQVRGLLQ